MDGNTSANPPSGFHLTDPIFDQLSFRTLIPPQTLCSHHRHSVVTLLVAVTVNVLLVVITIFIYPRLRTPSNLLIASLAISDVLSDIGLTARPDYITYRLTENQQRSVPCFGRIIYCAAFYICFGVSFMTLSAVSYERFVAVRLRGRYNAIFLWRRVVKK